MTIIYVKGDLFSTKCKYIGHGCNAQGVMGSGVAKQVKEKYPKAYEKYMSIFKQGKLRLGDYHLALTGKDDQYILNMITQENYGVTPGKRYVSYDAIDSIFSRLNDFEEIAIPKIGAGLGGGDWKVIEAIINSRTPNTKVYVYEI
jgi:O-acetyl-ADP-ribose deacetylase (regulator of RNase III)